MVGLIYFLGGKKLGWVLFEPLKATVRAKQVDHPAVSVLEGTVGRHLHSANRIEGAPVGGSCPMPARMGTVRIVWVCHRVLVNLGSGASIPDAEPDRLEPGTSAQRLE
jgi:hypothetical protein